MANYGLDFQDFIAEDNSLDKMSKEELENFESKRLKYLDLGLGEPKAIVQAVVE